MPTFSCFSRHLNWKRNSENISDCYLLSKVIISVVLEGSQAIYSAFFKNSRIESRRDWKNMHTMLLFFVGKILLKKKKPESTLEKLLASAPLIAAVLDEKSLDRILAEEVKVLNLLFGDIRSIPSIVAKCKDAGKFTLVHLDFVEGLSSRDIVVDYIADNTTADGIVSTKSNLIKRAKSLGLVTVQRFFIIDSISVSNLEKQFPLDSADALEIMPGVMPTVIRRIVQMSPKPVIAGGLISDTEDIRLALEAGALSASASKIELLEEFYAKVHPRPGSGHNQFPGYSLR